jgi:hypothetical protein
MDLTTGDITPKGKILASDVSTVIDRPVSSSPAQGTATDYSFSMDGAAAFSVRADADGSGGVQDRLVEFQDDIDIASGSDLTLGEIVTEEDTISELVDTPVTATPPQGTEVGYRLQLDNNDVVKVSADADGSGGVQDRLVKFQDDIDVASGADLSLGEIVTEQDAVSELVDTPVSATPTQGTEVGYRLQLDNNDVVKVSAGADGSGGTQNEVVEVSADLEVNRELRVNTVNDDGAGNITLQVNGTTVGRIDQSGNLDIAGQITEGVNF